MKFTKTEKRWLAAVVLMFFLYNLPGVPAYGDAAGAIIHGLCTLIPLWIFVYIGFFRICRIFRIRDKEEKDTGKNKPQEETKEDSEC